MKEIPQRDLLEISGGEQNANATVPVPPPSSGADFPRNPFSPIYDAPVNFED